MLELNPFLLMTVTLTPALINPLAIITDNNEETVKKVINDTLKERYGDLVNGEQKE